MKTGQLRAILQIGEGPRVEFNKANGLELIGPAVCGFLNSSGGVIVCGAEGVNEITGVDGSANAVADLNRGLQEGLAPHALVSIESHEVDGKMVLLIEVPAGQDIPYAFKDVIYIREAAKTRKADVETIRDMVSRKQVKPERWERRFSSADMESDLDVEEIRSAVEDIRKRKIVFFDVTDDPLSVLEDLSVAKYGRLTNGGDVLFGRNPARRHPQVRVRAGVFHGSKANQAFQDHKLIEGPLVPVLELAFNFIIRNTRARFWMELLRTLWWPAVFQSCATPILHMCCIREA